jgi:hypothetical protein
MVESSVQYFVFFFTDEPQRGCFRKQTGKIEKNTSPISLLHDENPKKGPLIGYNYSITVFKFLSFNILLIIKFKLSSVD